MDTELKTIIAGGRDYVQQYHVDSAMVKCGWRPSEVVSGKARGADTFGEVWARRNGIPVADFAAKWDDLSHPDAIIRTNKFGKQYDARAGIRRNHDMGDYAEALVAIWDEKSKGTKDMIDYATKKGLKVFVFRVDKV